MGKWLIHVKLLIVAIIWGLGWPAGRVVATEMPVSYTHLTLPTIGEV